MNNLGHYSESRSQLLRAEENLAYSSSTLEMNTVGLEGRGTYGAIDSDATGGSDPKLNVPAEVRETWDNKIQFILAVIGYSVGLGAVWRFPYLAQKNGGGAFLIPYLLMLVIEGVPIFYLELAVGQRLRKGAIAAWSHVSKYLGGMGIACAMVSFNVALYYNTIIAWCLFYLAHSFTTRLPWSYCPMEQAANGTEIVNLECQISGPTNYFWYRETLNISSDIGHPEGFNWKLALGLLCAWIIVYLCMIKGISSSGKVVYVTATFPYLVLIIFFVRGVTLPGCVEGIKHLFTPEWSRLLDANVWLEAATQIFFSLGLAFGGLIAFSSYMPVTNNCYRDAIIVSLTNSLTSIFAGTVVFSILGYKAHRFHKECIEALASNLSTASIPKEDMLSWLSNGTVPSHSIPLSETHFPDVSLAKQCDIKEELKKSGSGTGLAFIAFTEAINQFPQASFLWAMLFFLMLFTLGIDSMFGTLEGVVTSIIDLKLFPGLKQPLISAVICTVSLFLSMMFAHSAGAYVFVLFDDFVGNIPLLIIALMECLGIVYGYGLDRFSRDIHLMTGKRPGVYWLVAWKYLSPTAMIIILASSVVKMSMEGTRYDVWIKEEGITQSVPWPWWAQVFAGLMIFSSIGWIPGVAIVRFIRRHRDPNFDIEEDSDDPALFPVDELREHHGIDDTAFIPTRFESLFLGLK